MNLVATLKYRKTLRGSRSRIAGARRNGKEVCRAHFVRTVTFRRLCPLKELSDGQSESSVFRQGSFNDSQMRKQAPRSLIAAKSMGLEATMTPTPDMPAMKRNAMPSAVPRAPDMVRRHPYSAASVMIITTPSPGVRMFARLVTRKSAKRLDLRPFS